jgi:hypothetical protein
MSEKPATYKARNSSSEIKKERKNPKLQTLTEYNQHASIGDNGTHYSDTT